MDGKRRDEARIGMPFERGDQFSEYGRGNLVVVVEEKDVFTG